MEKTDANAGRRKQEKKKKRKSNRGGALLRLERERKIIGKK